MSALSVLSPPSTPSGGYPASAQSAPQIANRTSAPSATNATGGGAPAEAAQAAGSPRAIPPPTASRATAASSASRGDGRDTTAKAVDAKSDEARLEAMLNSDAQGDEARRSVEAARDRLVAQEILSRIPVAPDALPRLTADAERMTEDADFNLAKAKTAPFG